MTFEIFRCGTAFCWRLLDGTTLIAEGARSQRQRAKVEEEVLHLMDQLSGATITDKTSTSSPKAAAKTANKVERTGARARTA